MNRVWLKAAAILPSFSMKDHREQHTHGRNISYGLPEMNPETFECTTHETSVRVYNIFTNQNLEPLTIFVSSCISWHLYHILYKNFETAFPSLQL